MTKSRELRRQAERCRAVAARFSPKKGAPLLELAHELEEQARAEEPEEQACAEELEEWSMSETGSRPD